MGESSPFLSSCSRRQLARRRPGRLRRSWYAAVPSVLLTATIAAVGALAYLAGSGVL
jgi:hypothetical protein